MSFLTLRQRLNRTKPKKERAQSVDDCHDSCPLLGGDEKFGSNYQPARIRDVRRIDNVVFNAKKSLVQRIQNRKNRLIQRVLVACRVAEPSRDQEFKQTQTSKRTEIEQLTMIRDSLHNHAQSVVDLSKAFCCNPTRVPDDDKMTTNIRNRSLVFRDQAERCVLAKVDCRIVELKRINSLIENRAKLVLDVDYAKRMLALEHQKGNVTRIAERKQALQAIQLDCEQATRFITEQLQRIRPSQDTGSLNLFQEYALLAAQFFTQY